MKQFETMLDEWLVKKAPFQLPDSARKGLVSALPWLTLVGGVLMLLGAWGLYQALSVVSQYAGLVDALYGASYVMPSAITFGPLVWLSLALLVVEAVMFFAAFPALQVHKKSGWNLLFYVALLNVVEVVLQVIGYTNLGSLIISLLGSVVGLYLLFQVRGNYSEAGSPAAAGSVDTMKTPKETPPAAPASDQKPEDKV